jgi:DNA-binding MarR family transcriptional regulator
MRQVRRLNRRMHNRIKPIGIDVTLAQLALLRTLEDMGSMRATDLAHLIGLSASSLTGQIDRLEAEGYVERRRSREDRREVEVSLTPLAVQVLQETQARVTAEVEELFAALTDEEIETVTAIIDKLID